MRILLAVAFLLMDVGLIHSADAAGASFRFAEVLRVAGGPVTVPPEWDGIWVYEDSVYTCAGEFLAVAFGEDTLCAGQVYTDGVEGSPFEFSCSGTADATSASFTCTASGQVAEDCNVNYEITSTATRTGDSYEGVTTTSVEYSGAGEFCDLIPGSCTRTVTRATRTGPAPQEYCVTSPRRSSFGELKTRYR